MTPHTDTPFCFIFPWRVEGRQTAFHPWVPVSVRHKTLSGSVAEADRQKRIGKFYATRVRPN
jgi:hypothetical protein